MKESTQTPVKRNSNRTKDNNNSNNSPSLNSTMSTPNKKRKLSNDYMSPEDDDDIDAILFDTDLKTKWNLDEKVNDLTRYTASFVQFLNAKEFTLKYFQENGFTMPLVFTDKTGLGLRVPSENFKVSDVKACVGSKRIVDVVDVDTQKGLTMSMKDWCAYYESPGARDRLLNVISLEFSHTKLENYVEAPQVVRQLDWIDTAWPQSLIAAHTESTNAMDKMKYPKVQKYVLMSVKGCYTDFHIDMGGTSVWYHILKGSKVFWLIPPTEKNLKMYEKWTLSGDQHNVFLPDIVEDCQRIELKKGWTFMLPSGWIHGVYTKEDSLVFGGNFLHSFNAPMQLKVFGIEQKTKVPMQHRYPFFVEIMWFVMERYVHCLTGMTHLREQCCDSDAEEDLIGGVVLAKKTFLPDVSMKSLTRFEFEGLKAILAFVKQLCPTKKAVPKEIVQPDELLEEVEALLAQVGEERDSMVSVTGTPITYWPKPDKKFMRMQMKAKGVRGPRGPRKSNAAGSGVEGGEGDAKDSPPGSAHVTPNGEVKKSRKHNMRDIPRTKGSIKKRLRPQNVPRSQVERRRRVRCHKCEPCTRDDCGECKYCKDMKKFGGSGISKQCCLSKQCLAPLLPTTSMCMLCNDHIDRKNTNPDMFMYECEICFEIYHFECFKKHYRHLKSYEYIINEDLDNCWTCPSCVSKGFHQMVIENERHKKEPKSDDQASFNRSRLTNTDEDDNTLNMSELGSGDNSFTLESLSHYERKIILEEFCEISSAVSSEIISNILMKESLDLDSMKKEPVEKQIYNKMNESVNNEADNEEEPDDDQVVATNAISNGESSNGKELENNRQSNSMENIPMSIESNISNENSNDDPASNEAPTIAHILQVR